MSRLYRLFRFAASVKESNIVVSNRTYHVFAHEKYCTNFQANPFWLNQIFFIIAHFTVINAHFMSFRSFVYDWNWKRIILINQNIRTSLETKLLKIRHMSIPKSFCLGPPNSVSKPAFLDVHGLLLFHLSYRFKPTGLRRSRDHMVSIQHVIWLIRMLKLMYCL